MGEVWDIGKSTKKGIILNSHARTGLYKSWQIIVDNYIKQDNAWNDYRKEKGLSLDPRPWQGYKDGVEEHLISVMKTGEGVEDSPYFKHIKNPIEPFVGIALDVYGMKHPFNTDPKKIFKELMFVRKELYELPPFGVFGAWNEWRHDLLHWKSLKEMGYKIVNLHRHNLKDWFISCTISMISGADVGASGFHAWDQESADYILDIRRKLKGSLRVTPQMIMTFLDSVERYLYASREIHTDAYCIYESLQTDPEVFMKECELDMTQDMCEDFFTLVVKHPVEDMTEYMYSPDAFEDMWRDCKKLDFQEEFKIDITHD